MPATSWRSHCACSSRCSPAELARLADGPNGFVLPPDPCNQVYPQILLGDAATALSTYKLSQLGVTHVLNTAQAPTVSMFPTPETPQFQDWGTVGGFVRTSEAYYRRAGIQFLGFPAFDTFNFDLSRYFHQAADFIHNAIESGGKVLVHCHAGISRSATIVAAYLMIKRHMSAQEAIRTIRVGRSIRPNGGFLQQLCDLNENLLGERRRADFAQGKDKSRESK